MSSSGTPPAKGTTAVALNYLRHWRGSAILLYQSAQLAFLGPPSTTYSHSAILFSIHVFLRQSVGSVSSRAILFSNHFFLRLSHVSVTTLAYWFSNHVFHRHPPAKVKMAAALISTYFTGGGPASSFTNPHGWQTCGHLLLRILTASTFFPTTSSCTH